MALWRLLEELIGQRTQRNEFNIQMSRFLLVLSRECGNEPRDSLKGSHRDGLSGSFPPSLLSTSKVSLEESCAVDELGQLQRLLLKATKQYS